MKRYDQKLQYLIIDNYHPNSLPGAAILFETALSRREVCFLDSPRSPSIPGNIHRSPLTERPFRGEFTTRGEYSPANVALRTHP